MGSTLDMKKDGCSLIFVKVTNPNVVKVTAKYACITHAPNHGKCPTN